MSLEDVETNHKLYNTDARDLSFLDDESVHLVITSPPYWNIKDYNESPNQLGHVDDYEKFHSELKKVWKECYRVLVPGGRLVCVVGDACKSRREFGRHVVFPNHADIQVNCRKVGFDNLNPILWHKISNANYEIDNGTQFLGKPYQPNGIIKNDIEYILMQRKPGSYRKPTEEQREKSRIEEDDYGNWFKQIWRIPGESTKDHPAPFPKKLAYRLVRMFSFYGDTILDPFCGSGTSMIAAMEANRNSIGVETDEEYCEMAVERLKKNSPSLFAKRNIKYIEDIEKD